MIAGVLICYRLDLAVVIAHCCLEYLCTMLNQPLPPQWSNGNHPMCHLSCLQRASLSVLFIFFILINFYKALNLCYTILHYITLGYRTWIHYSTTTRLVVVVIENQIYPCNQKSHWALHCAGAISSWTRPCMLHMAPAVDHPCMHSLSHFFFCCQSHDWLDQPHSQTNLRLGSRTASPFKMKTMQRMIT